MNRYRLVPTRGQGSMIVHGDDAFAEARAREHFEKSGVPVLVCAAPLDGIVRPLFTVGGSDSKVKRR